jgi:hypothetical protein
VLDITSPTVDDLSASNDDAMEIDGQEKIKSSVRDKILSGAIFAAQESLSTKSLNDKGRLVVIYLESEKLT